MIMALSTLRRAIIAAASICFAILCLGISEAPSLAQVFPTSAANDQILGVASDATYTTLSASASSTDLTLNVKSTAGFISDNIITFTDNGEKAEVCSTSGTSPGTLTICSGTRGYGISGIAASSHAANTMVAVYVNRSYLDNLRLEVKGIEGAFNFPIATMTRVTTVPFGACSTPNIVELNISTGSIYSCVASVWTTSGGGGGSGAAGAVYSQTNSVTDSVITTETSLTGTGSGSNVLTANFFTAGTALKFEISGYYSTSATPGTVTIKIKMSGGTTGTVVLGTTGATTPLASVTNGVWRLYGSAVCRTTGTAGTLIVNTILETTGSSLITLTPAEAPIVNTATVTVDTTAAQTFDVTATWSAASQSITSTNYVLSTPGSGSGGGGATITAGTFAALPAACTTGNEYITTDSVYTALCTSTNVYTYFISGAGAQVYPPPASGTFTSDNIGASVFNTTNGYLYFDAPKASATAVRALYVAAPATPYTLTVLLRSDFSNLAGVSSCTECTNGIGFRDASGKLIQFAFGMGFNANTLVGIDYWTNSTTISSTPFGEHSSVPLSYFPIVYSRDLWESIRDDGTNLIFKYSIDGTNFVTLATVSRTAFMVSGPTQIGAIIYANTGEVTEDILSWKVQ